MSSSVLDKRPAKAATALRSSPRPGPLPGEPGPAAPSGRPFWILGAVVALLTFAVFLPSVRNGWVNWDDADNFLGNPHFRGLGWSTIRWIFTGSVQDAHWIPFTWLTLSLDHAMWGMNPAGYHLTSLLIHSINALLCYVLAYRLLELGFGAGARPRDQARRAHPLGTRTARGGDAGMGPGRFARSTLGRRPTVGDQAGRVAGA